MSLFHRFHVRHWTVLPGLLVALLCLVGATRLQAQCGTQAHNFCDDTCCYTDAVLLNTGYNCVIRDLYQAGDRDDYWQLVEVGGVDFTLPTSSNVSSDEVVAEHGGAFPNSRWIDANLPGVPENASEFTYRKCFCVCDSSTTLTFTMSIAANGEVIVWLDGEIIQQYGPGETMDLQFTRTLGPGRHCLEIEVKDAEYRFSPLNVTGTIQGHGLLKPSCCNAPPTDPLSACQTDTLHLISDASWTIESGPAAAGTFPRAATIAPTGPAISGANWIAPNTNEASVHVGPPLPQFIDVYVYRKVFCVDQSGTFIITITSSADDVGDIYLNGVHLGATGGRGAPTTQTFVVGLSQGCNCFEFRVEDWLACCTGMSAIIDIQGGILLKEDCCDCANGGNMPHIRSGRGDEENRLSGVHGNTDAAVARPTLVSVPNPTTGEAVVHYVLDRDADARVELYNTAGQRVMTLDEGARTIGEHTVNLTTKTLPAGAYRLLLVYGDQKLSVPVTIQ